MTNENKKVMTDEQYESRLDELLESLEKVVSMLRDEYSISDEQLEEYLNKNNSDKVDKSKSLSDESKKSRSIKSDNVNKKSERRTNRETR